MSWAGKTLKCSGGGSLKLSRLVGKGTCCEVYCTELHDEQQAAVKVYKEGQQYSAACEREVQILNKCQDAGHFLSVLDQFVFEGHACLVTELCEGHIWHLIAKNHDEGLSLYLVQTLARQLFRCLENVHSLGYVHGDVKPCNLMWSPQAGTITLIDYSLAFHTAAKDIAKLQTTGYRAPEVDTWNEKDYKNSGDRKAAAAALGTAMDVWSAGVVIMDMLLGKRFLPGSNAHKKPAAFGPAESSVNEQQLLAERAVCALRGEYDADDLALLAGLVSACLSTHPADRITAEQAQQHPFFTIPLRPSFVDMVLLPTCVLRLMNVLEEVDMSDTEELNDVVEDVLDGCREFGSILKHVVPKDGAGCGKVYVQYGRSSDATSAYEALSHRTFNDRTLLLTFFPIQDFNEERFY